MPVPKELDYERWQGPAPRAPYTLNRVHTPQSFARPGWMRHLFYCDGMITNWGTHLNNGAMWATDKERTGPVEIDGKGVYPGPDSFWNVLLSFDITYRFADGLEWIYKTEKPYFRIEGDEGWIYADFRKMDASSKSLLTLEPKPAIRSSASRARSRTSSTASAAARRASNRPKWAIASRRWGFWGTSPSAWIASSPSIP
jgi:myo-inositol 2-dehydrogenase/D-chiro-inositol 1-dehydrogenase